MPVPRIEARHVAMLEAWMDAWSGRARAARQLRAARRSAGRGVTARGAQRSAGAPSGAGDAGAPRSRSARTPSATSIACRMRCSSRPATRTRSAASPSHCGTLGSDQLRCVSGGRPRSGRPTRAVRGARIAVLSMVETMLTTRRGSRARPLRAWSCPRGSSQAAHAQAHHAVLERACCRSSNALAPERISSRMLVVDLHHLVERRRGPCSRCCCSARSRGP